jgi:hypothetical protein
MMISDSTVREVVAGTLIALGSMYRSRKHREVLAGELARLKEVVERIEGEVKEHIRESDFRHSQPRMNQVRDDNE